MLPYSPGQENPKERFLLDKRGEKALFMLSLHFPGEGETMRHLHALAIIIGCLALCACANTDVIVKKQAEMEARLEQLIQGNAASTAQLAEMANEVKDLQKQVKANATALEELKSASKGGASEVSSSAGVSQTPRIEVVNEDVAPGDRQSNTQDAYMKAFGLFSANNYNEAVMAFESFIRSYPKSEYAGNAQYWIGECYYTQHDFPQAMEAFNKVVEKYPTGNKVPDAMLKIGLTYVSMNEPEKARVALQSLLDKYPRSQAAAKARERLGHN
jgi:tol-pal system protein YbgF